MPHTDDILKIQSEQVAIPVSKRGHLQDILLVYVFVPTALALLIASVNPARTDAWPLPYTLAYWLIAVHSSWLLKDACTRVCSLFLRPRNIGLLAVLLAGSALSIIPNFFMMRVLISGFSVEMGGFADVAVLPRFGASHLFGNSAMAMAIWVSLNVAFVKLLRIPRFGYYPASKASSNVGGYSSAPTTADGLESETIPPSQTMPPFLNRLDRSIGQLYALQAEQHYIRVIGSAGESLIRYRMSDAVDEAELAFEGLRVHRSWWIAKDAAVAIKKHGRERRVVLPDGREVPVSRTYLGALDQIGLREAD